jgi:hypothetical protein
MVCAALDPLLRRMRAAGPGRSCAGAVWFGRGELMVRFWRRRVQPDPAHAQPAGPANLAAWAREVDVSRLSDQTVREAEDYLKMYRHMNLDLSQQMGWRVIAAVEAQVTPSPPAFAQPLDVIATVVALRRKQLGID